MHYLELGLLRTTHHFQVVPPASFWGHRGSWWVEIPLASLWGPECSLLAGAPLSSVGWRVWVWGRGRRGREGEREGEEEGEGEGRRGIEMDKQTVYRLIR